MSYSLLLEFHLHQLITSGREEEKKNEFKIKEDVDKQTLFV